MPMQRKITVGYRLFFVDKHVRQSAIRQNNRCVAFFIDTVETLCRPSYSPPPSLALSAAPSMLHFAHKKRDGLHLSIGQSLFQKAHVGISCVRLNFLFNFCCFARSFTQIIELCTSDFSATSYFYSVDFWRMNRESSFDAHAK